mmetsp:Transcript_66436/g.183534  ORF Transcript_66436/g.183534 Transcript_66436/m.183534 type:complete len:253 (-) Transcript_66436:488-1246(-)
MLGHDLDIGDSDHLSRRALEPSEQTRSQANDAACVRVWRGRCGRHVRQRLARGPPHDPDLRAAKGRDNADVFGLPAPLALLRLLPRPSLRLTAAAVIHDAGAAVAERPLVDTHALRRVETAEGATVEEIVVHDLDRVVRIDDLVTLRVVAVLLVAGVHADDRLPSVVHCDDDVVRATEHLPGPASGRVYDPLALDERPHGQQRLAANVPDHRSLLPAAAAGFAAVLHQLDVHCPEGLDHGPERRERCLQRCD